MTERLRIENASIVRLELKAESGANIKYTDLAWPGNGELLLNDGPGGAVAHGPAVNGFHVFARFPGESVKLENIQVSARPLDSGSAADPKTPLMTILQSSESVSR